MKYIYQVKVVKEIGVPDAYSYAVVAASGREAVEKALRQAKIDSGYKTHWNVINLNKGDVPVVGA